MEKEEKTFFITIVVMAVMVIWSIGVFIGLEKMENIKDTHKGGVYEISNSSR